MPHDPNPIWDELCAVLGLKPVTKAENARIGRIVRDLKAKDAEPGDIARVVAAHRKAWPSISLVTPESIHKHWDQLIAEAKKSRTDPRTPPPLKIERNERYVSAEERRRLRKEAFG